MLSNAWVGFFSAINAAPTRVEGWLAVVLRPLRAKRLDHGTRLLVLVPALLAATAPARGQCTPQELAKLVASDAEAGDKFGDSVAIEGDTAVVGAYRNDHEGGEDAGAAYINVRSGGVWSEQAKLIASDAAPLEYFGRSVALSGDTVVVGAPSHFGEPGSAYVFVRSGTVWIQQAKLIASDGAADGEFGFAVALSGDTAVVGAPSDNTGTGSAYVFVRSGTAWTQQTKLTASDAAANESFGYSVALSGDTAVVGAAFADRGGEFGVGSAYVFVRSGVTWTEQVILAASDVAADDFFGYSVALSGDTAVVGARDGDSAGGPDTGSAYVFVRSGTVWTQQAKLTACDAATGVFFGYSVAVSGDTAVVGASADTNAGGAEAGSAYVFVRGGTAWTQQAKMIASDAAPYDRFGDSVAVSGDTAVVGASAGNYGTMTFAGAAYVFEVPTVPGCPVPITASNAAANDWFGNVAINGDTIVVGARNNDNASGVDAGAAYVYVRSGPPGSEVWTQQAKLIGANLYKLAGSQSGVSVAISGDTALVGSWLWPNVTATGTAYVFVRSGPPGGEVWTQQAVFYPDFGSYQYFGVAVALEGDTAVVGALVSPGGYGGSAYFFARTGLPGGEFWTSQTVYPSDGMPGDQFGVSVAMSPSQDTAVVGAWFDDNAGGIDAGSAYIFTRTGTPAYPWVEHAKLTASDGAAEDQFGRQVAIVGDTIVVGARLDDHGVLANAGSGYVFTRSGTVWTQQAKLTASDGRGGDEFGLALALSGDTVIVGAYSDDHAGGVDAGSAYVFTRSGPPGSEVWTEQLKLTAPDAAAGDVFGGSVALSGDTAVVGAPFDDNAGGTDAGSVYVFNVVSACTTFVPPDFDCDCDVDGDDLQLFEACASGPGIAPAATCEGKDFDHDNDVDQSDFAVFQRCYSGENNPADPNCAD